MSISDSTRPDDSDVPSLAGFLQEPQAGRRRRAAAGVSLRIPGDDAAGLQWTPVTGKPTLSHLPAAQREQLRLDALQDVLQERGKAAGDIGYTSPLWARLTLPYSNPGDAPFWQSSNHKEQLVITPGTKVIKDGPVHRRVSAGYPYGRVPRLLMTYIATEVKRTGEPTVDLGDSQREFFSRVGLAYSGRRERIQQIQDVIQALAVASIRIDTIADGDNGERGWRSVNMSPIDGIQLWLNTDGDHTEGGLWGSSVHLTDAFYQSIANRAMPLYLDDLRLLGSSSLAHDVYIWLTYRLRTLTRPVKVSWTQLAEQFGGAQYDRLRDFRTKFLKALRRATAIYDDANVEIPAGKDYIILRRSKPRVIEARPARKEIV